MFYLIYINVGYFFVSSFDNFQDNFDHFVVIGIQLYKNKKISKLEKLLPAVRWLLQGSSSAQRPQTQTPGAPQGQLDYYFKNEHFLISKISSIRMNINALKCLGSLKKESWIRQYCFTKKRCSYITKTLKRYILKFHNFVRF